MRRLVLALVGCLMLASFLGPASAAPRATLSDIEDEVMCPTCGTALSLSESPLAERQRALIQRLIDRGRSKEEIKARLVEEFGQEVLAAPPRRGFALAAYLVPLAALVAAVAGMSLALRRRRRPRGDAPPESRPTAPGGESAAATFEELVDADVAAVRR